MQMQVFKRIMKVWDSRKAHRETIAPRLILQDNVFILSLTKLMVGF
jgi:CRISPR/Cas system-associated protein endoribonuclease Cas2